MINSITTRGPGVPLLLSLLAFIQPSAAQAAMSMTTNENFSRDLIIGIVVAAVVTVVVAVIVCTLAQCGPRLCGRRDDPETWFSPKVEEGRAADEIHPQGAVHQTERFSGSASTMAEKPLPTHQRGYSGSSSVMTEKPATDHHSTRGHSFIR
jgi:hypothetical protein